jgi:hypothetical protein
MQNKGSLLLDGAFAIALLIPSEFRVLIRSAYMAAYKLPAATVRKDVDIYECPITQRICRPFHYSAACVDLMPSRKYRTMARTKIRTKNVFSATISAVTAFNSARKFPLRQVLDRLSPLFY